MFFDESDGRSLQVNPIPPDLAGSTWSAPTTTACRRHTHTATTAGDRRAPRSVRRDGGPKAQGWLLRFSETSPNVYYNNSANGVGFEETGHRFAVSANYFLAAFARSWL